MQCLNPIIADISYTREDGKATLRNFRNFKNECQKHGDDFMLDIIKNGRSSYIFLNGESYRRKDSDVVLLPCRKCVNCQLNRSREWAIRNTLEAGQYDDESKIFLTLTYNDDSLIIPSRRFQVTSKTGKEIDIPKLCVNDVQRFLKRFRKKYSQYKIRFYLCGEYGGKTLRPHYHILLYGLPLSAIDDLDELYRTKDGIFYNSAIIEKIWSCGFINISTFSNYTAMYTSRYCTKKQIHNSSLNYCFATKELKREFNTMSLKPAIANNYIINHFDDVYKHDEFLFHIDEKTFKLKPLHFFDMKYDFENPTQMAFIKENRKMFAQENVYFEMLESNYGIVDYLNNCERQQLNLLNKRGG